MTNTRISTTTRQFKRKAEITNDGPAGLSARILQLLVLLCLCSEYCRHYFPMDVTDIFALLSVDVSESSLVHAGVWGVLRLREKFVF